MKRIILFVVGIIVVVFAIVIAVRYFYVFGEGVKSGELNYVVKKGYIFKTYEGKLIQSGIRSRTPGSIQSYEFEFSVENERIAQELMRNSGKEVDLHYKEYFGKIWWRGNTVYIVDSILGMREIRR
jgi:hypothetical protein